MTKIKEGQDASISTMLLDKLKESSDNFADLFGDEAGGGFMGIDYDELQKIREQVAASGTDLEKETSEICDLELPLFYESGNKALRDTFIDKIKSGENCILFASPEAITSQHSLLKLALLDAAKNGSIKALVVDEAHHLEWNREQSSEQYLLVDELASLTPGVLLLTATPEQLGRQSHFARLRLLDPDRFSSFDDFLYLNSSHAWLGLARKIEKISDIPSRPIQFFFHP